jgi:hypothetical protein
VSPNVGRTLRQWQILDLLGVEEVRNTWEWCRQFGHFGAGTSSVV